jgi:hypothetical protein
MMSSFPGRAHARPSRPVSAHSGRKEFIELIVLPTDQADAVLPADTEAP